MSILLPKSQSLNEHKIVIISSNAFIYRCVHIKRKTKHLKWPISQPKNLTKTEVVWLSSSHFYEKQPRKAVNIYTQVCTTANISSIDYIMYIIYLYDSTMEHTMFWSFKRWIILEDHSDIAIASGELRINFSRHRAALCFTESIVSLWQNSQIIQ